MGKDIWKSLEIKSALAMLFVVTLVSTSIFNVMFNQYFTLSTERMKDDARNTFSHVKSIIDERVFIEINTPEDRGSELFKNTYNELNEIRRIANIKYLYIAKRDADGVLIYVVDACDNETAGCIYTGEPVEEMFVSYMERSLEGEVVFADALSSSEYGLLFMTFFPYYNSAGEILGIVGFDFDAVSLASAMDNSAIITIIISAVIAFSFIGISVLVIKRTLKQTKKQFSEMENSLNEARDRLLLMLDTSPICAQIWARDLSTIDCNEAGVRLYGFKDKEEYTRRFLAECSPEYQPCGRRSDEKAVELVNKAFEEGKSVFEWEHRIPDENILFPAEVTLVRVKYKDDDVVIGYTRDLRDQLKIKNDTLSAMEAILDSIDANIYVTVIETGELLFVNKNMRQLFGLEGKDLAGLYCYKVFRQGFEDMCSFCPCYELVKNPDKTIVWDEYIPAFNAHVRHSDRIIEWYDGRKVHLQHAIDISGIMNTQKSLEKRDALLEAVNKAATILLTTKENENIRKPILASMELVARAINASRIIIWRNEMMAGKLRHVCTYKWFSEHKTQMQTILEGESVSLEENSLEYLCELTNGKHVKGIISEMSQDNKAYFGPYGTKSIVIIPLFLDEQFWGFFSVDDCIEERIFSEEEIAILRSVSLMMANTVNRNALIEKRTHELALQTATLSTLLDSIPDLIFTKDLDYRFMHCNKAFSEHFGHSKDVLIGKRDEECLNVPDETTQMHNEINSKIIAERETFKIEEYILKHDGTAPYFVKIKVPLILDNEVVGILGIAHDITERRAQEQNTASAYKYARKLTHALARIAKSPAISSGVLQDAAEIITKESCEALGASTIGIWLLKEDGKSLESITSYFASTREHVVQNDFDLIDRPAYAGMLKTERVIVMNTAQECTDFYNDFDLSAALDAPIYVDGKVVGVICVEQAKNDKYPDSRKWLIEEQNFASSLSDFAALAISGAERRRAQNEAETANMSKSAFIANVSHEIRTPMNIIMGLTELMIDDEIPADDKVGHLEKIRSSGNLLMGIINDILDFSKIESGNFALIPIEYDMASMLNDIITFNAIRIREKPIKFIVEIDADSSLFSRLYGDDLRIKQILSNLLSNAYKYTHQGEIKLHVKCERDEENENEVKLFVSVSDTGIGIREEHLGNLFKEYQQIDSQANRLVEGTGLGLSIAKKLTELMNGEIRAESEYCIGSTFHVMVRQGFISEEIINEEIIQALRGFAYQDRVKSSVSKLSRPDLSYAKVLVVDDFVPNIDVAKGLLGKYKMKVDYVTGGQDAIDRISGASPVYDAVFMDHMMPGMDGIEATRRIRALGTPYAKEIPVIALTANAAVGNEKMFLSKGFQAFLSKPINVLKLDAVVRTWIMKEDAEIETPEDINTAIEEAEGAEAEVFTEHVKTLLKGRALPAFDLAAGYKKYGSEETYLQILSSYAGSISTVLDEIEAFSADDILNYKIKVHGIKGASLDIYADVGAAAFELEKAAIAGDTDYINANNPPFIEAVRKLISGLTDIVKVVREDKPRPLKNSPDKEALTKLGAFCEQYNFSEARATLTELERYQYESEEDNELVKWLRSNLDTMNFSQIAERLK